MSRTVEELIERLQKDYRTDELVVGVVWAEGDIASIARDCRIKLTRPEMLQVVDRLNSMDSGIGIGWEDIKDEIYRIERKRESD